jgi:hypothetical protein
LITDYYYCRDSICLLKCGFSGDGLRFRCLALLDELDFDEEEKKLIKRSHSLDLRMSTALYKWCSGRTSSIDAPTIAR